MLSEISHTKKKRPIWFHSYMGYKTKGTKMNKENREILKYIPDLRRGRPLRCLYSLQQHCWNAKHSVRQSVSSKYKVLELSIIIGTWNIQGGVLLILCSEDASFISKSKQGTEFKALVCALNSQSSKYIQCVYVYEYIQEIYISIHITKYIPINMHSYKYRNIIFL